MNYKYMVLQQKPHFLKAFLFYFLQFPQKVNGKEATDNSASVFSQFSNMPALPSS